MERRGDLTRRHRRCCCLRRSRSSEFHVFGPRRECNRSRLRDEIIYLCIYFLFEFTSGRGNPAESAAEEALYNGGGTKLTQRARVHTVCSYSRFSQGTHVKVT